MAEREAVQLGTAGPQRNASFFQQAAQTNKAQSAAYTSNGAAEFLGGLGQFANTLSQEAMQVVDRQVEEDRIKQSTIAAQDVWKSAEERAGISQDATVAGRQAYNAIISKHDVQEANNRLVQQLQENPEMSEEDFQKAREAEYKPLMDKYGVDKWTMRDTSMNIQESQQALVGVSEKIRGEYRTQKREEAINISINDMLGDPNATGADIVEKEIPARAAMMGVSEFSMKKMLMQAAVTKAGQGDVRLLDQLDKTDWSKGSQLLKSGRDQYDQWRAREMAPMIGDEMGKLELAAVNGEASWGSTLKKIEGMNQQFPGSYSAHAIASLRLRMDSAAKARVKQNVGYGDSMLAMYNQDHIPLGLNGSYSEKERSKITTAVEGGIAQASREMQARGADPQQASDWALKQSIAWSRANRIKLPGVASQLEAAISYNPDDYKGGEMPDYVKAQLNTLKALDPQTLNVYLGQEDQTFAKNFQTFSRNMPEDQAFRRAMNIRQNPFMVTPTMKAEQQQAVQGQVEEVLDPAWYAKMLGSAKEVPEWQRKQVANKWSREAESALYAGGLDPKKNAEATVQSSMAQMAQTFNGTLVNIPAAKVRQALSADGKPVSQPQADAAMEAYTLTILPELRKEYGREVSAEELAFDFNKDGSAFRIFDTNGEQIGGSHLTADAARIGKSANLDNLRKTIGTGKAKTKQAHDEAQEALYNQLNGGLFRTESNRYD